MILISKTFFHNPPYAFIRHSVPKFKRRIHFLWSPDHYNCLFFRYIYVVLQVLLDFHKRKEKWRKIKLRIALTLRVWKLHNTRVFPFFFQKWYFMKFIILQISHSTAIVFLAILSLQIWRISTRYLAADNPVAILLLGISNLYTEF